MSLKSVSPVRHDRNLAQDRKDNIRRETPERTLQPYPKAAAPTNVKATELGYVTALMDTYSEHNQTAFTEHAAVFADTTHGSDLWEHRNRYFDAKLCQKFYCDNMIEEIIDAFRKDIRLGVQPKKLPTSDTLARIDAVMGQAAGVVA